MIGTRQRSPKEEKDKDEERVGRKGESLEIEEELAEELGKETALEKGRICRRS